MPTNQSFIWVSYHNYLAGFLAVQFGVPPNKLVGYPSFRAIATKWMFWGLLSQHTMYNNNPYKGEY